MSTTVEMNQFALASCDKPVTLPTCILAILYLMEPLHDYHETCHSDDQAKESVKKHDRVPIDELKGAELHSKLFFEMFTFSAHF